jgi:P-type E1-E2 ATPase
VQNKANFKSLAKTLKVLARTTPADKLTLIVGLKELDNCVAMTADGINDVDALRNANVGICMGVSGCDAAKEASDMIILDDNFNTVYKAVKWGKNMYSNIRKFI